MNNERLEQTMNLNDREYFVPQQNKLDRTTNSKIFSFKFWLTFWAELGLQFPAIIVETNNKRLE
jgi:hypothetical protein